MLDLIDRVNLLLFVCFTACYFYQIVYIAVVLFRRAFQPIRQPGAVRQHRYAVTIAARNEEAVIGELVRSIRRQNYPAELVDIFVVADNSSDGTARVAEEAGARVYIRNNRVQVGKGYALDFLFKKIQKEYPGRHEAFFVFDADNLLDPNYIAEMNKVFDRGYRVITCYRNSKNYGDNWISAGYALWFIRESKYLNQARMLLGTGCAISGTGFLVSADIIRKNGGWKHHLLTEDIEFSIEMAIEGEKIGYCGSAVIYDEQPTRWKQSWNQRLRWSKGFYQVFAGYGRRLAAGALRPGNFACFDMLMTIAPALLVTLSGLAFNGGLYLYGLTGQTRLMRAILYHTSGAIGASLLNTYLLLFFVGLLTTVTEWKQIHCGAVKKVLYLFSFPIFIFSYIPIAVTALFQKVEWKPIQHGTTVAHREISAISGHN